jgi:amino acid transporter
MRTAAGANAATELERAEETVEARSAVFAKELGLIDLAFMQVLIIVGPMWVGTAGKLGSAHLLFWLAAILLFDVPMAIVVIYLNRLMPLEGGLYQWAKLGFSEWMGFMVAWNLWLNALLLLASAGLLVANALSYALGPSAAWMATDKSFITAMGCTFTAAVMLLSARGFGVAKWMHNTGSAVTLLMYVALLTLPIVNVLRGTLRDYHPFAATTPALSLFSLNIFAKMAFGAFCGFEQVAIFAGECRNPARTIAGSVLLAAPVVVLMYVLGTSAVLAFVRPGDIDLVGPIPQVLTLGFNALGLPVSIAPFVILASLAAGMMTLSVYFSESTRLPLVTGWDALLPEWFTRLHPRYKTPINSILFVGAATAAIGVASLYGVGEQEAFQLLLNTGLNFYALTYLVMFAIPLIGLRGADVHRPLWLRLAAVSGLLVTLLFAVLSLFPIIEVGNGLAFTVKVIAAVVTANLIGAAIFVVGDRRRRREG